MAGRYKPYPEYKNSGVQWLGEIPNLWSLSRHKYVANFQKGKNPTSLLDEPKNGELIYLSMDYLRGIAAPSYAQSEKNCYIATDDQVLVIWDGSNAGEFVKAKKGIVSSTMAAADLVSDLDVGFYWYACMCLEPEMRRHATGMGIPHVNGEELKSSVIPRPSISEQQSIANFLDHETAKIDTLIEKQQQLIQLLKEKRQAVISHAVTKGLNPNAKMKNSGVEWLGEVPEHWVVKRVKHFGRIVGGFAFKSEDFTDTGARVIKIANVSHLDFDWTDSSYLPEKFLLTQQEYIPPKNSLLFAMTRPIISGGVKVAKLDLSEPLLVNQRVGFIKPSTEINQDYLMYVAQSKSFFCAFENNITATNQPNISPEGIEGIHFACPSIFEQEEIVAYLTDILDLLEKTELRVQSQLELLNERRTALISAAVTGKIDVRNWVAPQESQANKEEAA